MKFSGNAREFLGSANITTGKYTQIRMAVTKMEGTLKNGTVVAIKVPSNTWKIVSSWTVEKDVVLKLTVDFDLNKSLNKQGNGGYSFKPTLKLLKEKAKK
jgi:hypothetical protein